MHQDLKKYILIATFFFLQVADKLAEVDSKIGQLMEGLYQQDMLYCVNILIIADHGKSKLFS